MAERADEVGPGPDSPTDFSKRSMLETAKRSFKEFQNDNITDWSAALTYYAVLSVCLLYTSDAADE